MVDCILYLRSRNFMQNISNFNKKDKKKLGFSIALLLFSILIFTVIIFFGYNNRLKNMIRSEAKLTLKNVSSQNVITLNHDILSKKQLLQALASQIQQNKDFDIPTLLKDLEKYVTPYNFYDIGIIDKDGFCYTSLDKRIYVGGYDYYKDGMKGISSISETYLSKDKTRFLNIFTAPIYVDNQVEMILAASYSSKDFSSLLNITSFDGHGNTLVIDSEGTIVSAPTNTNYDRTTSSYDKTDPFYRFLQNQNEMLQALQNATPSIEDNYIYFDYRNENYTAYYEKTGINDWYLISYVPTQYLYKNTRIINQTIFWGIVLLYSGVLIMGILSFRAYTKYQKKFSSLVFVDDLTHEKNYEYLKLYFNNMTPSQKKNKSLVVFDIDKFKGINIIYGTDIGDSILQYIPKIFKKVLPFDSLFKYQADIYIAILEHKNQNEIIQKINSITQRIDLDAERGIITPFKLSFGICSLEEFDTLHSIYTNALLAKTEIKGNRNKNFNFFHEQNKTNLIESQQVESKFNEALKNKEFEVWYQPKYNMQTNEICGSEALVRWRNNDGNLISPGIFIPVFENNGQIIQLDEEVISQVFQHIKEMEALGLDVKPISINLSRVHLEHFMIVDRIQEMMKDYAISPSKISFEVTESALLEKNEQLNTMIHQLKEIGFEVDIDDYGTGVSTLNSLAFSDFNTLKLDKSFIDYIGNDKMNIIIKSTIALAQELNMKIIAEGVETQEQVDFLLNNHCYIAQGYYFSKPLDKQSYFSLLKQSYK